MRIDSTIQSIVLLILLVTAIPAFASDSDKPSDYFQKMACEDALRHAEQEFSRPAWFCIGCFGSVGGWAIAMALEPSPPINRLLGKPPEYIAAYTKAYVAATRQLRTNTALIGCMIPSAIAGIIVLFSAALL